MTHPALLFGHKGTLPVIDNTALLGRNIFAHLVLYSLALPLINDLALGHCPGGALLLHDWGALLLVPKTKGGFTIQTAMLLPISSPYLGELLLFSNW